MTDRDTLLLLALLALESGDPALSEAERERVRSIVRAFGLKGYPKPCRPSNN